MLVIPVLVDDAKLPETKWGCELDKLRELQHARIRNMSDFDRDFTDLCDRIEKYVPDLTPVSEPRGGSAAPFTEDIYFLLSLPEEEEPDSFNRILENEMRTHDHFARAQALPLSNANYKHQYSSGFNQFVKHAEEGAWLFTIRPEEGTWPYESLDSKEKLLRSLATQHKHVIFFESDDDLRIQASSLQLNPNPIVGPSVAAP